MLLGAAILTVCDEGSPTAGGGCVGESLVLNKLARLGYAAQRAGSELGPGSGTRGSGAVRRGQKRIYADTAARRSAKSVLCCAGKR